MEHICTCSNAICLWTSHQRCPFLVNGANFLHVWAHCQSQLRIHQLRQKKVSHFWFQRKKNGEDEKREKTNVDEGKTEKSNAEKEESGDRRRRFRPKRNGPRPEASDAASSTKVAEKSSEKNWKLFSKLFFYFFLTRNLIYWRVSKWDFDVLYS